MTNWLDPAEVRANKQRRRLEWERDYRDYDSEDSKDEWWLPIKTLDQASMSMAVLEALSALDPSRLVGGTGCDENCNRNNPFSNAAGKPCDCTQGHFERIWRIAKIVCGKE